MSGELRKEEIHNQETEKLKEDDIKSFWRSYLGPQYDVIEAVGLSIIRRFVDKVVWIDPKGHSLLKGSPRIYLANHQSFIESVIATAVFSALDSCPLAILGKQQHVDQLLGKFQSTCMTFPGAEIPQPILYVNREDPLDIIRAMQDMKRILLEEKRSILVHVEGRRSYNAADKIDKLSSIWVDLAVQTGLPIVPVRFLKGLPQNNQQKLKYDFPVGFGKQDIYLGTPIAPQDLAQKPYAERLSYVRECINSLGSAVENSVTDPDPEFERAIRKHQEIFSSDEAGATIYQVLKEYLGAEPADLDTKEKTIKGLLPALLYAGELMKESGQSVELVIEDTEQGQWLYKLAAWLYGEQGPRLAIGSPASDRACYHVTAVAG